MNSTLLWIFEYNSMSLQLTSAKVHKKSKPHNSLYLKGRNTGMKSLNLELKSQIHNSSNICRRESTLSFGIFIRLSSSITTKCSY